MKTKKPMQSLNLRYFSSFTANQKQNMIIDIRIIKNGLISLPRGLAIEILKNKNLDEVIKENDFIYKKIKGIKVFYHPIYKKWYPLNINEILNNK